MSVTLINPRAVPGDNQPPSPIDSGKVAVTDLSRFLAEHPVIQTEDEAREGKLFVDRMRATLGEIEDTRVGLVKPLNDEIAAINETYKSVHNTDKNKPGTFDKIFNELKARLTAFAKAEEQRKEAIALEAKRVRDEAEREALEAEQRERDAIENARAGELGVDVTQVVVDADSRFNTFKQADRAAARAEREINTRIGGGFSGRAIGLRTVETLLLDDALAAVKCMGVSDNLRDAILSEARVFRKDHGVLPVGVSAVSERKI